MIDWLSNNKEWVFSGIGVTIITLAVNIFLMYYKSKSKKVENEKIINIRYNNKNIYSGKNNISINVKEGGDIQIGDK